MGASYGLGTRTCQQQDIPQAFWMPETCLELPHHSCSTSNVERGTSISARHLAAVAAWLQKRWLRRLRLWKPSNPAASNVLSKQSQRRDPQHEVHLPQDVGRSCDWQSCQLGPPGSTTFSVFKLFCTGRHFWSTLFVWPATWFRDWGTAACTGCRLVTSSAARPVGFQQFLSELSPTFASASVLAFRAPMNEQLPIYLDRAAALEMVELADASRTAGDSFSILETMGNQWARVFMVLYVCWFLGWVFAVGTRSITLDRVRPPWKSMR